MTGWQGSTQLPYHISSSHWWPRLLGDGLYTYFSVVSPTLRWRVQGEHHLAAARASGRPLLWSTWHGQGMGFLLYGRRHLPDHNRFVLIIVGDKRGAILARFGERLGGTTYAVDMSGNPVAAGRAVLRVVRALQAGHPSFIAPDGPDGPPFVPRPGVAYLARKAGAAVIPFGVATRHAVELPRWDRYLLPLPGARLHAVIGAPLHHGRDESEKSLLTRLSAALNEARYTARRHAGRHSPH